EPIMPRFIAMLLLALAAPAAAQQAPSATTSELRDFVDRYRDDRSALLRRYDAPWSVERRERLRSFNEQWRRELHALDYDALGVEERIDWLLLDNELAYQIGLLAREESQLDEMSALVPFAGTITRL